jgi:hypothetical protein
MSAVDPQRVPGCGLAAFVVLLFCLFSVGMTGILVSTYNMFSSGIELSPQKVSYGGVVDPAVLRPMRDAGLLAEGEVPDIFHAESVMGASACAVSQGKLLRLSEHGPQSIPLAEITQVEGDETRVTVTSATDNITCLFAPGEGGDRFKRMLENRKN